MPLQNDQDSRNVDKTVLLLLAIALNALEIFLPRIPLFPWLKPGLANCVTILWIVRYGWTDAILFSLLRTWIVGFYFGFSLLTLALSTGGGIVAALLMGVVWERLGRRGWVGALGIGVMGALLHNLTQLTLVYLLFGRNRHLFFQLPIMLIASVLFGAIVGLLSTVMDKMIRSGAAMTSVQGAAERDNGFRVRDGIVSGIILLVSVGLAFINNPLPLGIAALLSAGAAMVIKRGAWNMMIGPFRRFWLFFVGIASLHLFFSYGKRVAVLPLITEEGAIVAVGQVLRLYAWLQLSVLLNRFRFHAVFFDLLRRTFPRHQSTLYAGVLALEFFPHLTGIVPKPTFQGMIHGARHPISSLRKSVHRTYERVLQVVSPDSGVNAAANSNG